jgi:hypothetical protein
MITPLRLRLRYPKPTDVVQVTFTGTPRAVADVARALASVVPVTSMRHHVRGEAVIRLEATCHHVTPIRRGSR